MPESSLRHARRRRRKKLKKIRALLSIRGGLCVVLTTEPDGPARDPMKEPVPWRSTQSSSTMTNRPT